jgi:3,4-dihydroxy 2-butanone 4-phosphate synthase/GTP cyclohydrolase II
VEIVEQIPIEVAPNKHNLAYLRTKRDKMGHRFPETNDFIGDA